jgi:hypothetical protein
MTMIFKHQGELAAWRTIQNRDRRRLVNAMAECRRRQRRNPEDGPELIGEIISRVRSRK